jgi:hypothetical protein
VSQFKNNIRFWYRYVDDAVCLWTGSNRQLEIFWNEKKYLNNKCIQFTMEKKAGWEKIFELPRYLYPSWFDFNI